MTTKKKKNHIFKIFMLIVIFALLAFFQLNQFSNANTLKFAQLSDSHLSDRNINTGYKALVYSEALLQDAITQINATNDLDFVFHTGDSVDTPKESLILNFCDEMNTLKYPWYMSFGNHDIALEGKVTKEYYVSTLNKVNKNFNFSKSYYAFAPKKGYKVIVLDGVIDYKITANGFIPDEQLNWLSSQINNTPKDDMILIFLHYPIVEPFSSVHHRIRNADEVYKILKLYERPIAVFSGHYHTTKIAKDGKILNVSSPSLVSYPNSFRIIQINNLAEKVILKFTFKETGLAEVQKDSRVKTMSSTTYYGAETDRTTTVELKK